MTPNHAARALLLWIGPAATIVGFCIYQFWKQVAVSVDGVSLLIMIGVALSAGLLCAALRWKLASGIAATLLVLLAIFAGPLPVLATLLLALAALGIGSLLIPESFGSQCARTMLAMLSGLALIAGTLGWLLPLAIHGLWTYLPMLLLIVMWRRLAIRSLLLPLQSAWQSAVSGSPWLAAFALLALGLVSTSCWLPTLQYDDLTYHLALPSQLQQLGYYRMNVASNVWALAPWTGDVLQAIVQIVAGVESRGALNALWLILTAALLWEFGNSLGMAIWTRWLVVAFYASQPMAAMLAGGMQTEGAATPIMLALAILVQRAPLQPDVAILRIAGVLAGMLFGLKIVHAVAILPLLCWLLWHWRGQLPWRALPGAIALATLVGGSSYAYAAILTGNPLLPLFNNWFHSSAFASTAFVDRRWLSGLHVSTPWQITFATSTYGEYYAGAAGFALIALAGALLLALWNPRTRAAALVGLFVATVPMWQIQYLRYAYPGLVLLLPVLVAAVTNATSHRLAVTFLATLCCLNLAFQPNAHWMLHSGIVARRVIAGEASTIRQFAPERDIAAYLKTRPNSEHALFTGSPFVAELAGRAYTTDWYDPTLRRLAKDAEHDATGAAWRAVFKRTDTIWIETTPSQSSPALKAALVGAKRVLVAGDADLWRLSPTWIGNHDLSARRDRAPGRDKL